MALAQGGPGGSGGPGSGGGQPTLSPQFQLNDWMTNEPATDRFSFPDQLPAIEGNTVTVVYDKGGSAQVQLFFRNNNPQQAFVGQLIVEDARYIHDTAPLSVPWGSPPPVTIPDTILSAPTVSLNIGIGQTAPATLSITGLPAFVTKGHIQLQMRAEGNFGAQVAGGGNPSPWSGTLSSQKVLITYAPPTGAMTPVWTELAEMSCTMAQGESVTSDINRELTKGLFFGNIFTYDLPDGPSYYCYDAGANGVVFNLKLFLSHLTAAPNQGGCKTINTFLGLLHHSQGLPVVGRKVECSDITKSFVTNRVLPIGSDASNDFNYIRLKFAWHFQLISNGLVADASLAYRYDVQGLSYMNPAYFWGYTSSWQTMINSVIFGLAYRYHLPNEDSTEHHPTYSFDPVKIGTTPGELIDEAYEEYYFVGVF
jgi:hypothetical protein